jgi:hypothetical protein
MDWDSVFGVGRASSFGGIGQRSAVRDRKPKALSDRNVSLADAPRAGQDPRWIRNIVLQ